MMVAEMRDRMSADEYLRWVAYYARKGQQAQLARQKQQRSQRPRRR